MIGYGAWNFLMWVVIMAFFFVGIEAVWRKREERPINKKSHNQLLKEIKRHERDSDYG